ncbi:uncharacterized protein LOC142238418 [Haematobia irritans]|uniref:uncharacterized protein LOC142238418 n=1 Tax=Haematobia irritans TaxID=7368 RepID=UPI003F4FCF81
MRDSCVILFILWMASTSSGWAQRSPFSLQAAVDELHRQEYPLNSPPGQQQHYMAGAFGSSADQDYWDEDAAYTFNTKKQRNRINKQLAKYLERENYEADHGGLTLGPFGGYEFDADSNRLSLPPYTEERKRSSVFRERSSLYDDGPASIFRERDIPDPLDRTELTDQFLREIESPRERLHQDRNNVLRNLLDKYQQENNEMDNGDIYEEQKKRMRMPPYYMLMQKKRSYPVLPWLPVERKKRFPVAKRSTSNHIANYGPISSLGKTDENVERELSELFGSASDEKKKRSIDDKHTQGTATPTPDATASSMTDMRLESNKNSTITEEKKSLTSTSTADTDHHQHAGHTMAEHKHGKRSNHPESHESHEEDAAEEEEEDSDEHESEEEDEHDHEEEEDEAKKKKKRDVPASAKRKRDAVHLRRTMDDLTMRSKKSIDWSNYFGLDRKKKAMSIGDSNKTTDMKKRDAEEGLSPSASEDNDKKKRNIDPTKLENMNKKLQAIEDFIISETIKYTGAHEGIGDPDEIQRLKDRVLSRLATAYSLEKMRRALEKLRQSVENENHIMHNIIEPDSSDSSENSSLEAAARRGKSNQVGKSLQSLGEDKLNEDMKRKMKKSNGFMRYPEVPNEFGDFEETLQIPNRYETLNDAYLGNKNYILGTNQCPILESMAQRCRGVDLLSGDINQELLPLCGVHQLCYLCGTSQIACDYQYLAEADAVCGTSNNNDCQAIARSVLMILRGTPGPQLGPRECVKNSCLFSAMREIGL